MCCVVLLRVFAVCVSLILILRNDFCSGLAATGEQADSENRIYFMKKCNGAGCPYTASWLAHINLYRKLPWWLDITKMEAASFNIFDRAKLKFQLSDPDAYFVHHMSMFEHFLHKKHGFSTAYNKTLIMSRAAIANECGNVVVKNTTQYLALIPFYGGLPPNVTKELSVKSIGQGNSLVDASVKAMQTMATLCSCLKYYGNAVVGVARSEDKKLIEEMLDKYSIREYVIVVHFKMHKPAHLPFHLLSWGQYFVQHVNCRSFIINSTSYEDYSKGFPLRSYENKLYNSKEEFHICNPSAFPVPRGGPINVSYISPLEGNRLFQSAKATPIRFVYYTECDQIVNFDSEQTLLALSSASNDSTFFTGRRKEKNADSDPSEYMGGLTIWRECGVPGYSLTWPKSIHVYHDL